MSDQDRPAFSSARDQKIMRARSPPNAMRLLLEIGQRLDRRVLRHDDGLGIAIRLHRRNIADSAPPACAKIGGESPT